MNGVLQFDPQPKSQSLPASASQVRFINKLTRAPLHRTFNHQNDRGLSRLLKAWPVLSKVISTTPRGKSSCDPCHESKFSAAPHKINPPEPVNILDKLSADTTGPLPESRKCNRYFTVLVDKCSLFYHSIPTKTKYGAELGSEIVKLIKLMQTSSGKILKRFQTDGAG